MRIVMANPTRLPDAAADIPRAQLGARASRAARFVPYTDPRQQRHERSMATNENHPMLRCPLGSTDERPAEGTHGGSGIPPYRKQRLRQAVPAAGSHAGDTRRFRMEHRGPYTHQGDCKQDRREPGRNRDGDQTGGAGCHADRHRVTFWTAIGIQANQRPAATTR